MKTIDFAASKMVSFIAVVTSLTMKLTVAVGSCVFCVCPFLIARLISLLACCHCFFLYTPVTQIYYSYVIM
jgi:hypothetical protein